MKFYSQVALVGFLSATAAAWPTSNYTSTPTSYAASATSTPTVKIPSWVSLPSGVTYTPTAIPTLDTSRFTATVAPSASTAVPTTTVCFIDGVAQADNLQRDKQFVNNTIEYCILLDSPTTDCDVFYSQLVNSPSIRSNLWYTEVTRSNVWEGSLYFSVIQNSTISDRSVLYESAAQVFNLFESFAGYGSLLQFGYSTLNIYIAAGIDYVLSELDSALFVAGEIAQFSDTRLFIAATQIALIDGVSEVGILETQLTTEGPGVHNADGDIVLELFGITGNI